MCKVALVSNDRNSLLCILRPAEIRGVFKACSTVEFLVPTVVKFLSIRSPSTANDLYPSLMTEPLDSKITALNFSQSNKGEIGSERTSSFSATQGYWCCLDQPASPSDEYNQPGPTKHNNHSSRSGTPHLHLYSTPELLRLRHLRPVLPRSSSPSIC